MSGPQIHPRPDNHGKPATIKHPSTATPLDCFDDPTKVAIVVPDGEAPESLNGIGIAPWSDAPTCTAEWSHVNGQVQLSEPAMTPKPGKKLAAGVVTIDPDGRIWVVAPTNAFGDYQATFPKGTIEQGMTPQATAIRESHEESGLQVKLTDWLGDFERSTSVTRYYIANRIGGAPSEMGWESQAVMLVPQFKLDEVLLNNNDKPLLKAIKHYIEAKRKETKHLINRLPPSRKTVVNIYQAELMAALIDRLEAGIINYFQVPGTDRIPLHRFTEVFTLPDYQFFLKGAYGSGFVCNDFPIDTIDINEVNQHPGLRIGYCDFSYLRHYVHTVIRGEKWAEGCSSPILEAIASGALNLVSVRLKHDLSLQESI